MTDNELLLSISDIMDKKLYPLEKRMDALDAKIDTVEQKLKSDIHLIHLTLENMVIPRLNEIETCYISTSERYLRETDKFISFESDLSVIKDVIKEHSSRLSVIGA